MNQDDDHKHRNEVTLRDVSAAVGLGMSTISRVLRNHGSFSKATRDRVMKAVDELGYVPNRIAGALASSGSNLVGIVIPSLHNIVFPDLLSGAAVALNPIGFQTVIAVTDYDIEQEQKVIQSMLAWRPAAFLVTGLEHTGRTRSMLKNSGVRVAELLDTDGEGIDLVVGFSQREAGAVSARHLLERGYRRIGYIGPQFSFDPRARKRFEGFSQVLAEAGIEPAETELIGRTSSTEAGRAALERMLARNSNLDAVYFSNDDFAVGGLFHCFAKGIAVPSRLAIMGYNGLDIGRFAPQPLTTLLTPRTEIGEIGARMVMEGGDPQVVDLPFEILEGATT
ncbi:substrate-binding domain-containing protein [Aliihoeflea aestuarii]|jgi:LacI family transcriptional regulator, gluconate utilization system Gnt-I transcriptional repressor|uniref:LacI family DNA-binding transcriptional regulator n=1 Tax=Aliihoeflea aestuarii TaxID=453840 RepID=UPI0020927F12|nr:LacI family DNA-binding transcriptional regulator [Aliihoeflea aestuarii]MCO6390803.1 substrate-binding domain-containing protein [Aliihoeflea aestuarii]